MIGVAISTHKRPETLAWALEGWAKALPAVLVVNHDRYSHGVAATKNAGIANLMDAGCHHLFLVDDDVHPKVTDWWRPYVDSPIAHLGYLRPTNATRYDDQHVTSGTPNGVVLYLTRHVVETVGGMRTEFGRHGSEHGEYSRRIHNAGLTPAPFLGLADSRNLWHALDFEEGAEPTVTEAERAATWKHRKALRVKYRDSAEFVDYR